MAVKTLAKISDETQEVIDGSADAQFTAACAVENLQDAIELLVAGKPLDTKKVERSMEYAGQYLRVAQESYDEVAE